MELTFNDFKKRATDPSLSKWEKIGFPDLYRKNQENLIASDIISKTKWNDESTVLDIGCGCSDLVDYLINHAIETNSQLYLNDSEEMLSNIVFNNTLIKKCEGYFPNIDSLNAQKESFDIIIVYSVIQYVYLEQSIFHFLHECIKLLKPQGRILIGDIPNISAKNRFLSSNEGQIFQQNNVNLKSVVNFKHEDTERIDDSVVISILSRFRNYGCETYLLPQLESLPFANRRDDILIIKR